jgi:hypothetical protein
MILPLLFLYLGAGFLRFRLKPTDAAHSEPDFKWVAGLFGAVLVALIVRHQLLEPQWTPHGPDWDHWFQSALAMQADVPYPPDRWPLFGWLVGAVDGLLPGPLFVNLQLTVLAGAALSVAGVFQLSWRLMGLPAAITCAALAGLAPMSLRMGDWTSAYVLWAAFTVWFVAGLAEAIAKDSKRWWVVTGIGFAGVNALLPKGLGLGLLLGLVLVLALLFTLRSGRRRMGRNLLVCALPIALLAAAYASFSVDLMTLDARVGASDVSGGESVEAEQGQSVEIHTPLARKAYTTDGYVFGQAMGPRTILKTLQRTQASNSNFKGASRFKSLDRAREAFPSVSLALIWLAIAGGMIGLAGAFFRGEPGQWIPWLGVGAVMLASALMLQRPRFQMRFWAPLYPLIPLLLAAPLAWMARGSKHHLLRFSPLLLLPLAAHSSSPWRGKKALDGWVGPVEVRANLAMRIIGTLDQDDIDGPIDIMTPSNVGVLILDQRKGRFLTPDPRFNPVTGPIELSPEAWVIHVQDPVLEARLLLEGRELPDDLIGLEGRPHLHTWYQIEGGLKVMLKGPVEKGFAP